MRTPTRFLLTLLVGTGLALSAPAFAATACPGKSAKKDKKDDGDEDEGFCPGKDHKKSDDKKDDDDDE
ncbi:MAG: hypothetical protein RIT45_4071 [Pseudomonadota bacterium]|jgi:hypothetical protein